MGLTNKASGLYRLQKQPLDASINSVHRNRQSPEVTRSSLCRFYFSQECATDTSLSV
ncbi:hypothetical protein SAMN05660836_02676 [Thermodesulforhabdus norvegica]|uniref:Uncharacterized protein n=1 Tax=Thermodesulforhabdus norvegica TaxID=39841 RepID=A0A1I4WAR7_9BACT|nr:hypothetical protein SAMN05660836_02676 [Thermodesulforhabdus norvegica]